MIPLWVDFETILMAEGIVQKEMKTAESQRTQRDLK